MQVIKTVDQRWEQEKKQQLVELGSSNKPYNEVLAFLEVEIQNSRRMTSFDHKITCFKNDGLYQLHRAITDIIGVASVQDEKTMSGGSNPPETVDIVLSDGSRRKVFAGKINLPNMGDDAHIDILYSSGGKYMRVRGECQFKYQSLIDEIVERTTFLLKTDSIYKNQAIEIIGDVDEGQPQILSLSGIEDEVMILSDKVEYALSPLKARILHADKCREKGIPLKFGCLLEGKYGTGKTLLAFKLAQQAIKNNWSFIYLKTPQLLAETLRMSKTLDKNGNGIIVFVED